MSMHDRDHERDTRLMRLDCIREARMARPGASAKQAVAYARALEAYIMAPVPKLDGKAVGFVGGERQAA